jgi:hypothetical protein
MDYNFARLSFSLSSSISISGTFRSHSAVCARERQFFIFFSRLLWRGISTYSDGRFFFSSFRALRCIAMVALGRLRFS